jgi:TrmH RNA methyltransferase
VSATKTEIVYGLRAGLAVHAVRRDDILRIAYAREVKPEIAELGRWASSRRIPCVEMAERELARIAESTHHEGLCLETKPRKWLPPGELAAKLAKGRTGAAVALDRVRNPYNVGAILRTAAFFGLDAVLFGPSAPHPALAPDAVRVAEGGAEHVALSRTTDLADTLSRLRAAGVSIVAADQSAETSALDHAFARPCVLVLGHEREGLSDRVRAQCDVTVAIRGTGAVESLNVAIAASLLIARLSSSPPPAQREGVGGRAAAKGSRRPDQEPR